MDSVGKIQAAGIMSGVGANKFAPKQNYTREQSIVTALKLYSYLRGVNSSSGGNSGSGSSGNNGGSSSVVPSGDFATVFQPVSYTHLDVYKRQLNDTPTYSDPVQMCDGIEYVIVGGKIVYHDKKTTGEYPGKIL